VKSTVSGAKILISATSTTARAEDHQKHHENWDDDFWLIGQR
jgi:hypothetical protein